jgi:hypothetical protein
MCWLCSYQGDPLGKQLNDFIIKNIGFMDMNCISQQVSDFLLLKQEEGAAPPAALLRDFALLGDAGGGGALASMAVLADELRERRVDLSLA